MCSLWLSLSFPLPPITWLIYGEKCPPPLILTCMWAYFNWVLSIVSLLPRVAVKWICDQLDWSHSSSSSSSTPTAPSSEPRMKELVDSFLGCHSAYFPVRFFGCLEFFSNSHLRVVRECTPWVKPLFTLTSLLPDYQKNHLIWVDSSLIDSWASFETLGSDNKDQPPPPDHLKNLLIWVDSIKVIPLGFAQYVPWVLSRIPQIIPATLALILLERWINWLYMYHLFSLMCIIHHSV